MACAIKRVVARFIPDVAKVIPKPYMVETREKSPIATAPILFDMYTLKATATERIITAIIAIKEPFIINLLNLFKPDTSFKKVRYYMIKYMNL